MNKDNQFEKYVPYIVTLKDEKTSEYLHLTTIHKQFCGFLVNNNNGHFYFELDVNRMLVIIPYRDIEYMAPSKVHFNNYQTRLKENHE